MSDPETFIRVRGKDEQKLLNATKMDTIEKCIQFFVKHVIINNYHQNENP